MIGLIDRDDDLADERTNATPRTHDVVMAQMNRRLKREQAEMTSAAAFNNFNVFSPSDGGDIP